MIASVAGSVEAVGLDHVVVGVGGVGMRAYATPATLAALVVGRTARLATSLVVREDSLTLYGFADDDERDTFETLQTVSGVGPRLALAMLAVHTPDGLRRAVADEDLAALQRVPGVGRKGAQRIVLEIGEKLGAPHGAVAAGTPARQGGEAPAVVEALVQLGWSEKAAETAVAAVLAAPDAPDEVPAILRTSLQHLAGHGRG